MIDTHVHLCDKRFDKDRQQVFDRAHHVGVTHFVEIAYGPGVWEKGFALAAEHPNVFLAVGVHPNSAADVAIDQLDALRSHARHARVVAIGEIGLDTFRDYAPLDVQENWFRNQLALADEVGLPVIIHQRSELERVLSMLEEAKPEAGGVLHCFDQDAAAVERARKLGFKLGLGGVLTYGHKELDEAVRTAPEDMLVLETDAPYLEPEPRSLKRNEPSLLTRVVKRLCELRGWTPQQAVEITRRNAKELFRLPILVAAALTLTVGSALAGTTGKLTGRVVDEHQQPLPGVSVRIDGQRLAGLTDDRGAYFIIGIPGGHYTVRMSLPGYASFAAANVEIAPDFSTTLDATLKTESAQANEVVNAGRPLLRKDATGSARFLSGNEIQRLPTRGYRDALAQEPGVVDIVRQVDLEGTKANTLVLRGGRPTETAYYVDGFSQRDPLTGNSSVAIDNSAIEEVVLLNGGFNAEYGRIMSGVVNVVTKAGGENYSGSFEALTDNRTGTGDEFFDSGIYDYNVYNGAFGGPLIKGRDVGSFYISGQRRWQDDRAPRSNYTVPLPGTSLGGWTGQGKLQLTLGPSAGLELGVLNSSDDWSEYRNSFRFNLAHMPRYEDRNQSYTGEFHHKPNARSFYAIGASFLRNARKRGDGLFFDNLPGYSATMNPPLDQDIPWFYPGLSGTPGDPLSDSLAARVLAVPGSTGALWDDYQRRESQSYAIRGDFMSQINTSHQIKAGVQGDKYELRSYHNYFPSNFTPGQFDIDAYGFDENANEGQLDPLDGPRKPITASAYVQDTYERGGLVANIGLRYDYLNVNAKALKSEDQPLGPDAILTEDDLTDPKTYGRLSPRVGLGFPVAARSMLHVNWGQFYQQPNLRDLYVSYRFLDYKLRRGGYYAPLGNPNLKPEMTTAYEVGFAHQVNDFSAFDVSVYYKDVKDYAQVVITPSAPYSFASFRNVGSATLKGVDLSFTLRRVNHVNASLGYSLSSAQGTGSVWNTQRNIAWTASQVPQRKFPLDFDQRHKLSVNLGLSWLKNEGPKWRNRTPLADVDVNVLYNLASGMPYTSTMVFDEMTQLNVAQQPTGAFDEGTAPFTQALDFKITKGFRVWGPTLRAYVWVLNAFNTANALLLYQGTGSPYTAGFLDTDVGRTIAARLRSQGIDPDHAYALATHRSDMFTAPRSVQFGLRMDF